MNKNKNKIATLCLLILLFLPCCINKLIFMLCDKHNKKNEKENFYDWRLGKIHYIEKGRGKPLLLLHGIGAGCSHKEYKNNIENLSKSYHVYAMDFLGFGYSDKPQTTYTAYMYSSLITDFIKDIIKQPTGIIASSSGAAFAVVACKMNPIWFKKLLLIEPTGIHDSIAENKDTSLRMFLESPIIGTTIYNLISSKKNCRLFLLKNILFAKEKYSSSDVWLDNYYTAHYGGANAKYALASFLTKFMNVDIKPMLKELNVPVYFVWGESSILNPLKNMEAIEEIKPRSTYAIFEQTRQLPHFENAVEFNQLAKEFFK